MPRTSRTSVARRNVAAVRDFLRLLEEKDIDGWIALWADGAEQFYPFGTEMFPPRVTGRQAIHERWKGLPAMFDSLRFPLLEHWVDGDTVIARFDGECVLAGNGTTYRNSYLSIFRFDETGLIREYWEYFDPILAGQAFRLAEVRYLS